jgi:EAL domain-containing protein (putative c-di-GMP-specific phosphodiesterase class I)/GGDEF domain-containing protein/ABC-type amino acid transport substrate-binding protein
MSRFQKNREPRKLSLIATVICLTIALSCFSLPVLATTGENEDNALMVGVPADRCPVFYQDADTGEIVGIGVDLMRAVAENAGYDVSFICVEEPTLKEALDNEAYDIVMPFGSAVPSASGKPSIVTDNLIQTPFTLVTEGNGDLPQLNELHVGMLHSLAAGAETVRQLYPGMEISLYDTMPECVKALQAGEVDALLHNSYVWSYVLQKPSYSDLKVQPNAMFSMDFRAGTLDTPQGREIIDRLNGGIAGLTDTRRQAITLDYTSRKLYQYGFSDYLYQYGLIMTLVVLLIIALIAVAVLKNRAVRAAHEEKLRQLVDHDPLTGVLSLDGFRKRAEELLRTHPDTPYLLVYINIKNFKFINGSLGRAAGDDLLRFWANRTLSTLSDEEAVGRVTADRFAVLRRNGGDEVLRKDDQEVLGPVRTYFIDRGKENRVLLCGGVYVVTSTDRQQINIDRMMDCARMAERKVRDTQNEGYAFYNPEQWEKGKQVADIINHLPAAIKSGGLHVWYQPQVNYETKKITGAEALCRWDHNKLGFLYPSNFIAVLEESGLIYDLDCFVWDKVCQDLHRWNGQGCHRSVSVNVSRCDIREDRDIPGQFSNLIQKYDISPDQLRIEITETAFAENSELLISNTIKLRELGFQVEMDDFGSGYSSLHMLKEVPVDRIKLDLHFLTSSGDQKKSRTIVGCMIQMVELLEMKMIAEGVETVEQAEFLHDRGCSEMQGYYFYKPMPVEEFEKLNEVI